MGEGTVTANGIRVWYEDFGNDADPHVVLIMGANATAMSWDAAFFEPIVAAGFHVVRFDNRDAGLSQWFDFDSQPYTLDDMAADTIGLMDALSIPQAHVIGVSMGGMIALVIALNLPGPSAHVDLDLFDSRHIGSRAPLRARSDHRVVDGAAA